jgi:drug/metabolite transporter (DMT)-like permease
MRWYPIALVVLANIAYHVGQKSVPRGAHPAAAALAMYLVAGLGALIALPLVPPAVTRANVAAAMHWSVALVGIGILGVEIGFLLVYRSGWEISIASLSAAVVLSVALVPIGVIVFREPLSLSRLTGLGLALAGLWLLQRP